MDWSFIIVTVVVILFVYRGYKKGLFKSFSRVLSLLAGYVATILYTPQVAEIVQSQFQLQGIAAFIAASIALFIGAGVMVGFIFWVLKKMLPANNNISPVSSLGGASMGLVVGVIVSIVIIWAFSFMRDMGSAMNLKAQAQTNNSSVEKLANRAASKAVQSAMTLTSARPGITRLSAALVESPAKMVQHARSLASSDEMRALFNDPHNQAVLNKGDIKAVQGLYAFKKLAKNPDLLLLAHSAGMLGESGEDNQAMEAALASQFTDIWKRTQRVNNDRRFQDILNDPDFQQQMNSANPVDILTNARLLELADIVFSDNSAPEGTGNKTPVGDPVVLDRSLQQEPEREIRIYRWTDENGRIQYSDVGPEEARP